MIVIERDGKTVVITRWRAWLLAALAVVVTTAVFAATLLLGSRHRRQHDRASAESPSWRWWRGLWGCELCPDHHVKPDVEVVLDAEAHSSFRRCVIYQDHLPGWCAVDVANNFKIDRQVVDVQRL